MDRMKRLLGLGLVVGLSVAGAPWSSAVAGEALSADQIKALISGKTVYAKHLKKGFDFKVYFDADGKTAIRDDGGNPVETTYSFDGDKHCLEWKGKNRCAQIVDNGDGTYSRLNKSGKAFIIWNRFVDGKDL